MNETVGLRSSAHGRIGLMLTFSPSEPFPLIDLERHSGAEMQTHAARVDQWLGLSVESVERQLAAHGCRLRARGGAGEHQELWFGLAAQSLLTPYVEIRAMLARLDLRPGQVVVDLGAAYGRMGFVIERHHPGVRFCGYEYVGERVKEANRAFEMFRCRRAKMEHADLSAQSFAPVPADVFFIYDYGTSKAIEKTLHDLRRIARMHPIVVVGRGRRCREAIETRHQWLGKSFPGEGEGRVTIYRSELPCGLERQSGMSL